MGRLSFIIRDSTVLLLALFFQTMDEIDVAIKTCKPDASNEDKVKFLEEACEFSLRPLS